MHDNSLPLDANGETVAIGDEVQEVGNEDQHGPIINVEVREDGWWVQVSWTSSDAYWLPANEVEAC